MYLYIRQQRVLCILCMYIFYGGNGGGWMEYLLLGWCDIDGLGGHHSVGGGYILGSATTQDMRVFTTMDISL